MNKINNKIKVNHFLVLRNHAVSSLKCNESLGDLIKIKYKNRSESCEKLLRVSKKILSRYLGCIKTEGIDFKTNIKTNKIVLPKRSIKNVEIIKKLLILLLNLQRYLEAGGDEKSLKDCFIVCCLFHTSSLLRELLSREDLEEFVNNNEAVLLRSCMSMEAWKSVNRGFQLGLGENIPRLERILTVFFERCVRCGIDLMVFAVHYGVCKFCGITSLFEIIAVFGWWLFLRYHEYSYRFPDIELLEFK